MFVHLLVWDTRYSETFFKDLLSRIFTITSYCLHVIMVSPPSLETGMDLFKEDMTKIAPRGKINENRMQILYLSLRHRHRPKLKIRRVVYVYLRQFYVSLRFNISIKKFYVIFDCFMMLFVIIDQSFERPSSQSFRLINKILISTTLPDSLIVLKVIIHQPVPTIIVNEC